jgi:tetratricopeptide (TPR) repeat protein
MRAGRGRLARRSAVLLGLAGSLALGACGPAEPGGGDEAEPEKVAGVALSFEDLNGNPVAPDLALQISDKAFLRYADDPAPRSLIPSVASDGEWREYSYTGFDVSRDATLTVELVLPPGVRVEEARGWDDQNSRFVLDVREDNVIDAGSQTSFDQIVVRLGGDAIGDGPAPDPEAVRVAVELSPASATLRFTGDGPTGGRVQDGATFDAAPGQYRYEVSRPGYVTRSGTLSVQAGQDARLSVRLEPEPQPQPQPQPGDPDPPPPPPTTAEISLRLSPGGAALRFIGAGPRGGSLQSGAKFEAEAGSYRYEVTADGYETATGTLTVRAGRNALVDVTLEPEPEVPMASSSLILELTPDGATVELTDESGATRTLDRTGTTELDQRRYTYVASSRGYITEEGVLDLRGVPNRRFSIDLAAASIESWIERGDLAFQGGDWNAALQAYGEMELEDGVRGDIRDRYLNARTQMGIAYMNLRDFPRAADVLQSVVAEQGSLVGARRSLGTALCQTSEWQRGIEELRRAQRDVTSLEASRRIGVSLQIDYTIAQCQDIALKEFGREGSGLTSFQVRQAFEEFVYEAKLAQARGDIAPADEEEIARLIADAEGRS